MYWLVYFLRRKDVFEGICDGIREKHDKLKPDCVPPQGCDKRNGKWRESIF